MEAFISLVLYPEIKNMEDSSTIDCLVFTGMHENEKRLKSTHTVLISRC